MAHRYIPVQPAELTADWLTAALREAGAIRRATVQRVDWEIIGQEWGFTGVVSRVRLQYDFPENGAPPSLVAKFPNAPREVPSTYREAQNRNLVAVRRHYERCAREIWFYQQVAPDGSAPVPKMYYGATDLEAGRFILLLEDLASYRVGDVLRSCSEEEAEAVVRAMGEFHARWWQEPRLGSYGWLPRWGDPDAAQRRYVEQVGLFLDKFGQRTPAQVRHIIERLVPSYGKLIHELHSSPVTMLHADLHLDNVLFNSWAGTLDVRIIDWQTISYGRGSIDLSLFLFGSLATGIRRKIEHDLLHQYHAILANSGIRTYSADDLLYDCRLGLLWQLGGTVSWLGSTEMGSLVGREKTLIDSVLEEGRLFDALLDYTVNDLLPL